MMLPGVVLFVPLILLALAAVVLVLVAFGIARVLPLGRLGEQRARGARRAVAVLIVAAVCLWFVRSHGPVGDRAADQVQVGMTMQEVEAILGRPYDKEILASGQQSWSYSYSWTFVDVFEVVFDENGRVVGTFMV
jgi:hypothetical protein